MRSLRSALQLRAASARAASSAARALAALGAPAEGGTLRLARNADLLVAAAEYEYAHGRYRQCYALTSQARCGEIWGDLGRCGEMWGRATPRPARSAEIWGDLGRSGEMWGELGRCGETGARLGPVRAVRAAGPHLLHGAPQAALGALLPRLGSVLWRCGTRRASSCTRSSSPSRTSWSRSTRSRLASTIPPEYRTQCGLSPLGGAVGGALVRRRLAYP